MSVMGLDHVALPADDPAALIVFYRGLGFTIVGEMEWRSGKSPVFAIAAGDTKINVHEPRLWQNEKFTLRGPTAWPGCGDLCFVWGGTVQEAIDAVQAVGGEIIEGPVGRDGGRAAGQARGTSVYTRDPDGNLVELIVY